MRDLRNRLSVNKLLGMALLLPLLQESACVYDPQQAAAFWSSQFYQLESKAVQNGIGEILDRIIMNVFD